MGETNELGLVSEIKCWLQLLGTWDYDLYRAMYDLFGFSNT